MVLFVILRVLEIVHIRIFFVIGTLPHFFNLMINILHHLAGLIRLPVLVAGCNADGDLGLTVEESPEERARFAPL